ncbi:MAG: PAS domain-containing protein, partial [Rhizobiales bacterium]|nr:PAS domain-containing protein [Hyphomicrobiales bacterium]
MDHPSIQRLFSYWNEKRRGMAAPWRTDINPGDIRDILPEVFLLERGDDGRFYYRLAGTKLCQNTRRELKGQRILAQYSDLDRRKLQMALSQVATKGSVFVAELLGMSQQGQTVEQHMLVLPLRHGEVEFPRLIGVCINAEEPQWLGRDPIHRYAILSARMLNVKNAEAKLAFAKNQARRKSDPQQAFRGDMYNALQVQNEDKIQPIAALHQQIHKHFAREGQAPFSYPEQSASRGASHQRQNFNVVPLAAPEKRVQHLTVFD